MGRKHIIKKKELLEAIKGSYGIMSTVAARLHCDWHTADDAIKRFPEALQAMADEGESVLDFTEGKAIERIRDGDGVMIRFMLATKGKKRGYTYDERIEDNDTDSDEPLQVICDGPEVDPVSIEAAESMEGKK